MATFVRVQEIRHEIGERGHIGLRVTSPDVEMRATDGDAVSARVIFEIRAASEAEADDVFERIKFNVEASSGWLEIAEPKDGMGGIGALVRLFTGGERADARVEVDAPRAADVWVNGVSSDLTAIGFAGLQEYRTVSGDLVLDRIGGDIQIRGVSSDVSLKADHELPSLSIETVSGDVSAFAPAVGQLRIVTVSGDVDLETRLADGPEHRVETVSGDLSVGTQGGLTVEVRGLSSDVNIRLPHRSEGTRDRRRYVIGDGGPDLLFSSMSGDVEVRPPRRGLPTSSASPTPTTPPAPPTAPTPPTAPAPPSARLGDQAQLQILQALERGEIDVDEAARRLGGESGR
jgi:hypothetical protein